MNILDKLSQIVDHIELTAQELLQKEGITEVYGLWTFLYFAGIVNYIKSNYDDGDIGSRAYQEIQNRGVEFLNSLMDYMLDLEEAPEMNIDGIKTLLSDYFDNTDNA